MTEIEWINIFGDNLITMLQERRMTQRDLSDMTGLSEATISKYVNKQQAPSLKAIINISWALNVDVTELIDFGERII